MKDSLPFMKFVIKTLARKVFVPIGLAEVASAIDAGIHQKIWLRGNNIDNIKQRNGRYHKKT